MSCVTICLNFSCTGNEQSFHKSLKTILSGIFFLIGETRHRGEAQDVPQ